MSSDVQCLFCELGSASKANIDAPYDYTLPASQNMCNGHRHRLIRYAEVKLWYAEAAARAGEADLTLARQCLKDVRKRGMVGDTYGNKKKRMQMTVLGKSSTGWILTR